MNPYIYNGGKGRVMWRIADSGRVRQERIRCSVLVLMEREESGCFFCIHAYEIGKG